MLSCRVIIVNYNSGEWLQRAIKSVLAHSDSSISVIDNKSTDSSFIDAQKHQTSHRITYIANAENVGFAAANNQVLAKLDSDLAILMNPDCEMHPHTLAPILAFFDDPKRQAQYAAASCRILNADGTNQSTSRRQFPTPLSAMARMLGLHKLGIAPAWAQNFDFGHTAQATEPTSDVPAISGAFMVMTHQAIQTVGLLDEGYFMHCEDLDWCKRCENAGLKIAFIAKASVTHAKGVSSRTRPIGVLWNLHSGMARFFDKFYRQSYGVVITSIIKLGIYASFVVRVCVNALINFLRPLIKFLRGSP